jgi:hypothetical protein
MAIGDRKNKRNKRGINRYSGAVEPEVDAGYLATFLWQIP